MRSQLVDGRARHPADVAGESGIQRGPRDQMHDLITWHIGSVYAAHRHEVGHGPAVDRDSQALAGLDLPEDPADLISQFALWNCLHAITVAYLLRNTAWMV